MTSIPRPDAVVDRKLVKALQVAREAVRDAERALSKQLLEALKLPLGSLVRDTDSGALYRVDGGTASTYQHGQAYVMLTLTRVYKTGRSPAASSSYRTSLGLERYKGEL